ncbi:arylphorin subunit alpha-like [Zerene cesonia]|uniref:arylphorin subunit alpha-like n=1 Tax=Zerene cesonia TaxID=33412 RepID=UPI0018E50BA2|nr:arylphorin subunit alpha-like [Zerene cesonia]
MWQGYILKMFLWLFFLGQILTVPVPSKSLEVSGLLGEGELFKNMEQSLKFIVPGFLNSESQNYYNNLRLVELFDQEDENFKILLKHIEDGHAMKGLTFNIYDDNMRETTIALFRIFQTVDKENLYIIRDWARDNINKDMLDYAWRLISLYRIDAYSKENDPPFISKPNYYINSEAIIKAFQLKSKTDKFDSEDAKINQIYKENDNIIINANYSSWNLINDGCDGDVDYFREDIGLNSYYYGVHLKFPFWMSNDELSAVDTRYAEQYYYIHQQLLARYSLEKEHLRVRNMSSDSNCFRDYNPYLLHDNGLPFPTRSSILPQWSDEQARIKAIDIAIRECISRGVIYMDNGTKISLTEDNYIDLLAKLIRANFDGVETAKIVKSLFGYGGSGYPKDRYNPSPSVLHNPQTTLRDPLYWQMIQALLKYFKEFSSTLSPFDFSKYETDNINIIDTSFDKITTYFDYYQMSLMKLFYNDDNSKNSKIMYSARQKRLKHTPFTFNFTIESKINDNAIIKLFLGPECDRNECWEQHSKFYELDSFVFKLKKGLNVVSWNPEASERFSFDDYYNKNLVYAKKNKFNLFMFPESLILPKGLEEGLNMTLFTIVIPSYDSYNSSESNLNPLPLGFPFHRQAIIDEKSKGSNYVFNKISIYHQKIASNYLGFYSTNLH